MKLHTLKPAEGSIKSGKRIARGQGSGRGTAPVYYSPLWHGCLATNHQDAGQDTQAEGRGSETPQATA